MSAAERDVAAALRAVRRAWPAVTGLAVSVVLLAADLFIRSVPLALVTGLVFAVCLGWWGTAAIRLHGAIRRAERHQESKGEVQ